MSHGFGALAAAQLLPVLLQPILAGREVVTIFAFGLFSWHLFVLAGSACHVVAVIRYA